jgi:hypothetical protein
MIDLIIPISVFVSALTVYAVSQVVLGGTLLLSKWLISRWSENDDH